LPHLVPRFEASHYLTEDNTQHIIPHNELYHFNYIIADEIHPYHFLLPSSIKPNDRLLLI
jgi:hypothetical protein